MALYAAVGEPVLNVIPGEGACFAGFEHRCSSLRLSRPQLVDLRFVDGLAVETGKQVRSHSCTFLYGQSEHLLAQVVRGLGHRGNVPEPGSPLVAAECQGTPAWSTPPRSSTPPVVRW